jgi:rSAM/selenodomain-associated transferase 1
MCRTPRIGANKTRLAKQIGAVKTWQFYQGVLTSTANRLSRSCQWHTILYVTPKKDARNTKQWPINSHKPLYQGAGDLGTRMTLGLTQFARGTPVILIGSDIPNIRVSIIQKVFQYLKSADIVFGPATDGGFWLIGFSNRKKIYKPFVNVKWSDRNTLADTLINLKHRHVIITKEMQDIDNKEDYDRFISN